jgi:hypothetical protein
MKKLFFVSALILLTGMVYGQTLQKGTVIGFHNGTFTPNPDVTMNQCIDFIMNKYFPEVEKNMPGVKCYLLKGVRGENVDCISFIYLFPSEDIRNKYWKKEGENTDLGNAAVEKMKPVSDEMAKFGEMVDKYTDWVVQ